MSKVDSLFLLVKSLTASEKALVRQVDKGQPGYLALFDFMSRQQEYDERKAKKKLLQLGHDINFAYAKNYLTKHILRVLREHEESGQVAVTRQLQEIEMLMARKVFDLADKMMLKAREKALSEERWDDFLQLTGLEMALLLQNGMEMGQALARIDTLNAERRNAREMMVNLGEFEDLYHRFRPIYKQKQAARNEWDLALANQFAADPLLSAASNAKSERAKRIFLRCQSMIHPFKGAFEEAAKALKAAVNQYKTVAFLAEDYPDVFLTDLWRLGGIQLHFGKFAEVESILLEIKGFGDHKGMHKADVFEKYTRLLLGYALQSRNYGLVNAEIPAIAEGLNSFADVIPWTSQAMLLLWMARLQFEQGKFKEAKVWLNQILDHPQRGQREDIHSLARIMLIFTYFETGESELTESLSKSTRKFLQRRDALYQFEKCILRFLEHNSFSDKDQQLAKAMKTLRSELQAIFKDPLEANILAYFDILAWLDVKIAALK